MGPILDVTVKLSATNPLGSPAPRPVTRPGLADSHVHLHAYDDQAIDDMLGRAYEVGVEIVVAVSVDLASSSRTLEVARRYRADAHTNRPVVIPAIGFHPALIVDAPNEADWREFDRLAASPDVALIGECGIDGIANPSRLDIQLEILTHQVRIATHLDLPVNLHLREPAFINSAIQVLSQGGIRRDRGVAHYFVGDQQLAERYLAAGLLLSVGKPVTRQENQTLREAIRDVPLDRLLLETDTYPAQGRGTEPADVRLVAESVAELKGISFDEVAKATTANLRRLLRKH